MPPPMVPRSATGGVSECEARGSGCRARRLRRERSGGSGRQYRQQRLAAARAIAVPLARTAGMSAGSPDATSAASPPPSAVRGAETDRGQRSSTAMRWSPPPCPIIPPSRLAALHHHAAPRTRAAAAVGRGAVAAAPHISCSGAPQSRHRLPAAAPIAWCCSHLRRHLSAFARATIQEGTQLLASAVAASPPSTAPAAERHPATGTAPRQQLVGRRL